MAAKPAPRRNARPDAGSRRRPLHLVGIARAAKSAHAPTSSIIEPERRREFHREADTGRLLVLNRQSAVVECVPLRDQHGRLLSNILDLAVVEPTFPDEDLAPGDQDGALLAVVSRGRREVFVYEPNGAYVTATRLEREPEQPDGVPSSRRGWPFFRLGGRRADPAGVEPSSISWEAPHLIVVDIDGVEHRLDLAHALLPGLERWLSEATVDTLERARQWFISARGAPDEAPALALMAIDHRLGQAWLERGEIWAAARAWGAPFSRDVSCGDRLDVLRERLDIVTRHAFRRGSAATVRPVLDLLRERLARERRRSAPDDVVRSSPADVQARPRLRAADGEPNRTVLPPASSRSAEHHDPPALRLLQPFSRRPSPSGATGGR